MTYVSKNLIGFEKIYENIQKNFLNHSLSHSLIFYGKKGIGKTTFTFSLINSIYNHIDNSYSNNSNLIYNNSHPNLRLIKKEYDDKTKKFKNYITIDQIRELESFVYQSTIDGSSKFIIFDSADDLNRNSSNCLLKILEEPTSNTYIILISHQLSKLLPTIRSRCIKFKFPNPSFKEFKKIVLNYDDSINDNVLSFLYDISEGSPGLAILFYSENISDIYTNLLEIFKEKKPLSSNIVKLSNNVGIYTNDQFSIFLSLVKFILINTIKINLGINLNKIFISDLPESLKDLSRYIDNNVSLKILGYLNIHENNLFVYNLDKKIFVSNIFSPLSNKA